MYFFTRSCSCDFYTYRSLIGLERAEVDALNEFNIYTHEAGSGTLNIRIEGPSKADIRFEDKNDESSVAVFKCDTPGE